MIREVASALFKWRRLGSALIAGNPFPDFPIDRSYLDGIMSNGLPDGSSARLHR